VSDAAVNLVIDGDPELPGEWFQDLMKADYSETVFFLLLLLQSDFFPPLSTNIPSVLD